MNNTSRPKDRTELEATSRKFETVFEHANDAIFIVDIENDSIVDCNPAAEQLVEYSGDELRSMPASDLHPHNLSEFVSFAETVLEEGEGWTDDITCYCKSGDIIPAEMSASVVELDGRPHLVNHIRERTESEERDWFEALIEHSNDLITVVKPDGVIRYQSKSIDTVLGYSPEDLLDENVFGFVHPDDRAEVRDVLETMVERSSGNTVTRLEYRFRRADGSWAWLESVASYRPDSSITGTVINSRDITPRKESQQQAAVLNRTLRHNLRNELNVMLGHAQPLLEGDSEAVSSRAEAIVSKVWDLHDIATYTKDLADILESHSVSQRRLDVTDLLERIAADVATDHPDAAFDIDVPSERMVMGAPKLDVALDHVVRNALEHNDAEQPRVELAVGRADGDGYVEVSVADNGPGIPEHEKEVLLAGEERPLKHASGLGLWIVNWIITRSGGRILFEDNEPRGSRVTLALPAAE